MILKALARSLFFAVVMTALAFFNTRLQIAPPGYDLWAPAMQMLLQFAVYYLASFLIWMAAILCEGKLNKSSEDRAKDKIEKEILKAKKKQRA